MISLTLLTALALPQEPGDLAAALKTQAERTAVVSRAMPSVCSVMALKSPGGGSGVIIDPAGFVVTNFHVVQKRGKPKPRLRGEKAPKNTFDPANKVMKIGLPDGRLYKADVLGIDPGSDLAILLIRPKGGRPPFPYSKLGDSDALIVGEAVFAAGNPFLLATDFSPTLTWGIVSGTHRYQPGRGNRMLVYPDCIQVDAPVNPGNSGGPLFNEKGEVVGINGRITVRDRGRVNTGVGFAIASNQIRNFLADMMAGKHAEHGTLDLNAWYMKSPGELTPEVIVQAIFRDAAQKIGITIGDQLTYLNDTRIRSANQLATLVGVLPSNSWVELRFRKHLENGGFGPEMTSNFRLGYLDTGSSKYDEERIAPIEKRKQARITLARNVGRGQDKVDGATVTFTNSATKETIVVLRRGDQLRWTNGDVTLVRTAKDKGFKIFKGRALVVSPEEQSKVEREFHLNPWLWRGEDLQTRIKDSHVESGLQALGHPAYHFRIPGPSRMGMFFFEDGSPAGYRYKDQLRKQLIDVMAHGEDAWFVADGKTLTKGWKIRVSYDPLPDPKLFKRPDQ